MFQPFEFQELYPSDKLRMESLVERRETLKQELTDYLNTCVSKRVKQEVVWSSLHEFTGKTYTPVYFGVSKLRTILKDCKDVITLLGGWVYLKGHEQATIPGTSGAHANCYSQEQDMMSGGEGTDSGFIVVVEKKKRNIRHCC